MEKEFKVEINVAVAIYLIGIILALGLAIIQAKPMGDIILVASFVAINYVYFLGCRPYRYVVDKKTIYIKRRLLKAKELELIKCELVCDPVSRWADIATRPHAIEVYDDLKKRYCFFPKKRVEFVSAIMAGNKRIHCTVKDYTDVHRSLERKARKERKKAERVAAKGNDEN